MTESRLLRFAKGAHVLQNGLIGVLARWHPEFVHSVEKIQAIKMAFHFVNYEGIQGDYVEFGVFEGASFISAYKCHRATNAPLQVQRRFFGFDSFQGLRFDEGEAVHRRLELGRFATDYPMVKRRVAKVIRNEVEWQLVPGFLDETLTSEDTAKFRIDKIAMALFDLDLGEPTKLALDFVAPRLQEGSAIIFDEFFMFRGDNDAGEAGALKTFAAAHPNIVLRRYRDYGGGGRVFIVTKV